MPIPEPEPPSWEQEFVARLPLIEQVITFVARRQHLSHLEFDDFSSHVKIKMIEDDYFVLRMFEGRSSLRTYITVVVTRMCQDFRNRAWGKWRPSAEAKRNGAVAILLEQLLVRDNHTFEEACEILATNHHVATSRFELEELAAQLPIRAKRRFEPESALDDLASGEPSPEQQLEASDRRSVAARVSAVLGRLTADLAVQDRLILTLRFVDGRTVAEIAMMLHLDQKALYRRVERALRGLRGGLQAAGIDAAMALDAFSTPAARGDWADRGNVTPRPSDMKGAGQWT